MVVNVFRSVIHDLRSYRHSAVSRCSRGRTFLQTYMYRGTMSYNQEESAHESVSMASPPSSPPLSLFSNVASSHSARSWPSYNVKSSSKPPMPTLVLSTVSPLSWDK